MRTEDVLLTQGSKEKPHALAGLRKLEDFSRIMGFPVFHLKHFLAVEPEAFRPLSARVKEAIEIHPGACIVAKQPSDDIEAVNALLKLGFYYVCGESVFSLNLDRIEVLPDAGSKQIRQTRPEDLDRLKALSRLSHADIRYYLDPRFDREKVSSYYAALSEKSFRHPDHRVFIYTEGDEILGYLSVILNRNLSRIMGRNFASLDYIAVAPSAQRQNIGSALNGFALNYLKENGINGVSVKTMASNYRAIRLLYKSSFVLTSQNMILHRFFN